MSTGLLPCVEVEPPHAARAAVIWLHGLGADGHDFEPIVPYLGVDPALAVRFVFPHAPRRPVTINAGLIMPAWYDVRTLTSRNDLDRDGVMESARHLRALMSREMDRGISSGRIAVAGFSQGGAMALYVGLRHPERLAGILALSTYLVCGDALEDERSEANRQTPIFQGHGLHDPLVPLELGRETHDRLSALGYSVEWKTYAMEHAVHPDEARDAGAFLARVFS